MKHTFLKSLDLPANLWRQLPSTEFDRQIAEFMKLRGHELDSPNPPDYRYFINELEFVIRQGWDRHDEQFSLELDPLDDGRRSYRDCWGFDATEDYPARILTVLARQMGWRLVPYARWVALHAGDQSLAHYVEEHCRAWCEDADTVFHLLINQKINSRNAATQQAMILPIRKRAIQLLRDAGYELRKYHL